jgi:hypothetical protein
MAQVQISDVIVPAEFTQYQFENSMVKYAVYCNVYTNLAAR